MKAIAITETSLKCSRCLYQLEKVESKIEFCSNGMLIFEVTWIIQLNIFKQCFSLQFTILVYIDFTLKVSIHLSSLTSLN